MSWEETDQLQEVQHQVELARHLFTEQGEFIRSVVRYTVCKNEDIEDLYQELFLFFAARPVPDDIHNIRGYLYKIVLDRVRDWQRSQLRYQSKIWQYSQKKAQEQTVSIQKELQGRDIRKVMDLIEKHLSKTETRAILLRYRNQYSIEETAREMEIRPRSVSHYVSTGLRKIRELLKKTEGDSPEGESK